MQMAYVFALIVLCGRVRETWWAPLFDLQLPGSSCRKGKIHYVIFLRTSSPWHSKPISNFGFFSYNHVLFRFVFEYAVRGVSFEQEYRARKSMPNREWYFRLQSVEIVSEMHLFSWPRIPNYGDYINTYVTTRLPAKEANVIQKWHPHLQNPLFRQCT